MSKQHQATGVIVDVLQSDALSIGINLDEMNIFMLGNACDHESRNMRFPMDKDFRDRDSLNEAIEAYRQKQALIRQVFVWGLYYLSGVLDNPKACRAFNIAWQKGHSNGFAEVASEFDDLLPLFKD